MFFHFLTTICSLLLCNSRPLVPFSSTKNCAKVRRLLHHIYSCFVERRKLAFEKFVTQTFPLNIHLFIFMLRFEYHRKIQSKNPE